jgi:hypothetical protein
MTVSAPFAQVFTVAERGLKRTFRVSATVRNRENRHVNSFDDMPDEAILLRFSGRPNTIEPNAMTAISTPGTSRRKAGGGEPSKASGCANGQLVYSKDRSEVTPESGYPLFRNY